MPTYRDVGGLLAHARDAFESISLDWGAEYNAGLLQRAFERSVPDFAERVASGSIARLAPPRANVTAAADGGWARHDARVWWRKPSCWRDETMWENGATIVCTACGEAASWYMSALRTMRTNQTRKTLRHRVQSRLGRRGGPRVPEFSLPTVARQLAQTPLVDPSRFARGWDLTRSGEDRHAGRDALRVSAARRGADAAGVWEHVDRYELLVDRERGVLLRCAGLVDGAEARVYSVRSARFDEPIADAIFSYQPPDGTTILPA